MSRTKKVSISIVLVLLAVCLTFALVACGDTAYTVTYDANGGMFEGGDSTLVVKDVKADSTLTVPSTPKATGAKSSFVGWSKDKTGATLWDFSKDKVTEDLTLYAIWLEENNYLVTLDVNGGTELEVKTHVVEFGKPYALGVAAKVGYTFLGWTAEWIDGGALLTDDKGASLADWNYEESKTLTASWSATEYTATLDVNGGDALAEADKTVKVAYDSQIKFLVPNKTGYNFVGWFDGTTQVTDYNGAALAKWNFAESKTLKAEWSVGKYIVNLDVNGGVALPSVTIDYDSDFSLTVPVRTGYTFDGWFDGDTKITDANGKGLAKWSFTNTKTFTAKWTVNEYTVTFKVDDSVTITSLTMEVTYDSTFKFQVPTRRNWVFKGWYAGDTQLTDGNGNANPTKVWSIAADTVVTAQWEINEYTVTLDVNGGDKLPDSSIKNLVVIGSDYKLPVPTRNLYQFLGWFDNDTQMTNANGNGLTEWNIKEDKTLTAKWVEDAALGSFTYATTADGFTITGVIDSDAETLIIPNFVNAIAKDVFANCNSLTAVYYLGEKSDWGNVKLGEGNSNLTNVVSFFSFGEPKLSEDKKTYEGDYWRYVDGEIVEWEVYTITLDVNGGNALDPNSAYVTYGNKFAFGVPTRTGGNFLGWYFVTEIDGVDVETQLTNEKGESIAVWSYIENMTLKAMWEANVVLTSSNETAGAVEGAGSVAYGSEVTIKATVNVGYTFIGWFDGEDEISTDAEYTFTVEEGVAYTAKFEANKYTITYNANGGSVANGTQQFTFGNKHVLEVPTRIGNYLFVGWFVGDRQITDETVWDIAEDTELKAKWEIDNDFDIFEYTITADGCTITGVRDKNVETITIPWGYFTGIAEDAFADCTKLKSILLVEDEYVWKTTIDGINLGEGVKVYYSASVFEYDLEAKGHVIKSVKNAANSTVIIPSNVTAIADGAFSACTQLKDVLFVGNKEAYAEIVIGENNAAIGTATVSYLNAEEPTLTEDKTKYTDNCWRYLDDAAVKWEVYVLTYNVDGGNTIDPAVAYVTYKGAYKLSVPTKDGYTFLGWYDGETQLTGNDGASLAVWNNLEGKTITAKWEGIEYTITYDAADGVLDSNTQKVIFGAKFELGVPTKDGFTFMGWYMTVEDKEVLVANGEAWNIASDVTLTAKWANEYTITYNADGGELEPETQKVTFGTKFELGVPTKDGFTFTGWYYTEGDKEILVTNGDAWNIANDVTLTAKWVETEYTITYNADGGEIDPKTQKVTFGAKFELGVPTKDGFTFMGWYYTEGKEEILLSNGEAWNIVRDVTLTAKWITSDYTISYDANGGELEANTQIVTLGEKFELAVPTKEGFTFAGWYITINTEKVLVTGGDAWNIASDVVLTAKWVENVTE